MSQRKVIWEAVENEDHSYYPYIRHVVSDVDPKVTKTLVTNFFINASLVGWPKQEKLRAELNCNISFKRSGGMKQGICGLLRRLDVRYRYGFSGQRRFFPYFERVPANYIGRLPGRLFEKSGSGVSPSVCSIAINQKRE